MNVSDMRLLSGDDGDALTKHPDVILASGELWACSCGALRLRMTTLTTSWAGEQPATAWCSDCGEMARWEPTWLALQRVDDPVDPQAHSAEGQRDE